LNPNVTLEGLVALRINPRVPDPVFNKGFEAWLAAENPDEATRGARYGAFIQALHAHEEGQRLARMVANAMVSTSFARQARPKSYTPVKSQAMHAHMLRMMRAAS
jgi:hypothetical protein